jgi:hypothetical protein
MKICKLDLPKIRQDEHGIIYLQKKRSIVSRRNLVISVWSMPC